MGHVVMLPNLPTITRDEEAAVYALAAKRFRRRRMVSRALWCLRYSLPTAVAAVALIAMLEVR